jgi:two-component system, OmpR family, response regulator
VVELRHRIFSSIENAAMLAAAHCSPLHFDGGRGHTTGNFVTKRHGTGVCHTPSQTGRRMCGRHPRMPPMEHSPHILIVDDDRDIRELLADYLTRHGCRVELAADGEAMFAALAAWHIDLVVLDLMLPGEDGLTLCKRLRTGSDVPVIMLTAIGDQTDRVVGLELGADDYVPKPCYPRELLARIRAVLRRRVGATPAQSGTRLRFDGWVLEPATRSLTAPDGNAVSLTAGEFDLLRVLVERPQQVLSRDQLLDLTRGREAGPFDRSIDSQVSRLRRKLGDDAAEPRLIKTVRNGGYLFTPSVQRE